LFKGLTKLLICGGYNPDIDTCEVINLASSASTCKNPPNFPATVYRAIRGLGFKGNPILCGGYQNSARSNKCYSLENNEWISSASMNSVRAYAAAAQLQDGKLLVTGGSDGSAYLKSAEILTEEGWENNMPSLPVTIAAHCMVTVNSTTVMVIGGWQNNQDFSGKTFYFSFGEESWTEGPELKNKRDCHSCGKIRRDKDSQEMSIIVAGGYDGSYLSSVEILDEDSNEWQAGLELPFGISYSQMIEDQNGGVVLIGGRSSSDDSLDTLFQLPHGGQDAVWTKMEQKMKIARYWHTAFLVPDNSVNCSSI
jgi:hypothetical protein